MRRLMNIYRRAVYVYVLALLLALPAWAQSDLAKNLTQTAIPTQVSAESVSNFVFTPSGATSGNALHLLTLTAKIGAISGYLMIFDATALPSNGAVTPCANNSTTRPCQLFCVPVTSNGTNGSISVSYIATPILASSGIVAGFSTGANCDTLTASATAKFSGQAL